MAPPVDRRPGFSRRAQYGLFLGYVAGVGGALAGIVLLVISMLNPQAFAAPRSAVAEVTAPVSRVLLAGAEAAAAVPAAIGRHFNAMDENARLRHEVVQANHLLARARVLRRENARLRTLLGLRERSAQPVAAARLVSSSASSTRRFALLNAGRRQGVRPGQPVRGADGLIGRIVESGPDTARVLLIVDPESAVPVRRTRDGLAAIVTGRGDGLVEVRSVLLANTPFAPGDVFVTSSVGGIFPPDVPVARVISRTGDGAVARVFAAADSLDHALVERAFMPMPAPPAPGAPM